MNPSKTVVNGFFFYEHAAASTPPFFYLHTPRANACVSNPSAPTLHPYDRVSSCHEWSVPDHINRKLPPIYHPMRETAKETHTEVQRTERVSKAKQKKTARSIVPGKAPKPRFLKKGK
jgi:hypothetical protein